MALTGPVPAHPAEFSPEVLAALRPLLMGRPFVFDPFAGRGRRLGALCDELGIRFAGCDIEPWRDSDPRVRCADASDPESYPYGPFTVVTSPPYFGNRISSDYVNGPTPTTKTAGRRSYGISLGRALHPKNIARFCRPGQRRDHDFAASMIVCHWDDAAIVNVDSPIADQWADVLVGAGYEVQQRIPVVTRRYRGPANSDRRADHEVVLVASRLVA